MRQEEGSIYSSDTINNGTLLQKWRATLPLNVWSPARLFYSFWTSSSTRVLNQINYPVIATWSFKFFSHLFNYNKWLHKKRRVLFLWILRLGSLLLLFQFSDLTPSWEHPKRNIKLSSKWWQVSRTCLNKVPKTWLGLGLSFFVPSFSFAWCGFHHFKMLLN